MRVEFVEVDDVEKAFEQCPWAYVCTKVEGGFKCFESSEEYVTWCKQN